LRRNDFFAFHAFGDNNYHLYSNEIRHGEEEEKHNKEKKIGRQRKKNRREEEQENESM
jgi:hypothetical protein